MAHSTALPAQNVAPLEQHPWKTAANWICAVLIALILLVAGIWKLTDPIGAAVRLHQAKVPQNLSLVAAILLGAAETFSGALLLIPRFRKWGAWLGSALLVAFMIYIGAHYSQLRGAECSCFPWVKRAVGPGFFIGDAIMLLLAVVAGMWAKRTAGLRGALLLLCAVGVFAGVSYGISAARQTGTRAPDSITVDGKPFSLQQGKIFIFYFDPECMHCLEAGRAMSKLNWGDTKFVGVPVAQPQFAPNFMRDAGLKGVISTDLAKLKAVFPFTAAPAGVALDNGREKQALTQFDGDEPAATLRKLGFVY